MNYSQPLLSIVIPVFNEASHITNSINIIKEEAKKTGLDYEIIIVDDGSIDNTWLELTNNIDHFANLHAIRLSKNFGKEAALVAGLEHASGAATIIMDGDLQHPPSLIVEMVNIWKNEDVDIVECIKKDRGKEKLRYKVSSKLFYQLLDFFTGYNLNGLTDYKLLDQKVLKAWRQMPERGTFFRGMTAWLGFKKFRYEFNVSPRVTGQTKWSLLKLIKLAFHAIISFTSLPLRFVSIIGLLFFIGATFLGLHTFYQKVSGNAVTGFTTVILLQLIIGSIFMLSLGIIGEYIAAIYKEVKGRPRYVIKDTLKAIKRDNK